MQQEEPLIFIKIGGKIQHQIIKMLQKCWFFLRIKKIIMLVKLQKSLSLQDPVEEH